MEAFNMLKAFFLHCSRYTMYQMLFQINTGFINYFVVFVAPRISKYPTGHEHK